MGKKKIYFSVVEAARQSSEYKHGQILWGTSSRLYTANFFLYLHMAESKDEEQDFLMTFIIPPI